MDIKHILLTTDLSEEALRPFDPVLQLARQCGAKVTLLHVVYDLMVASHGAALAPPISSVSVDLEVEQARKSLEELRGKLGEDLEVELCAIAGTDIAQAIVGYADEHEADLIALSTHGRSGWKHLFLGSVPESVLRRSNVPVLSFPRQK